MVTLQLERQRLQSQNLQQRSYLSRCIGCGAQMPQQGERALNGGFISADTPCRNEHARQRQPFKLTALVMRVFEGISTSAHPEQRFFHPTRCQGESGAACGHNSQRLNVSCSLADNLRLVYPELCCFTIALRLRNQGEEERAIAQDISALDLQPPIPGLQQMLPGCIQIIPLP